MVPSIWIHIPARWGSSSHGLSDAGMAKGQLYRVGGMWCVLRSMGTWSPQSLRCSHSPVSRYQVWCYSCYCSVLPKPKLCTIYKAASFSGCRNKQGSQVFWMLPVAFVFKTEFPLSFVWSFSSSFRL